jgi:hypothetical protein
LPCSLREQGLLAARDVGQVRVDHALGIALVGAQPLPQPEDVVAHLLDQAEAVGDEHDGLAPAAELADLVQALAGERFVAHRQHLVDEQHLGIDVHRHREAEAARTCRTSRS